MTYAAGVVMESLGDAGAALVVQHEDRCPPGFVGEWLAGEGIRLDVRRPYAGDPLPDSSGEHSGLVVLGGAMGAYDDADYPWLTATKRLVRDAVGRGTPLWGICLGHQLTAVALGGRVEKNPRGRADGLTPIGWLPERAHDPLCAGTPEGPAVQWNNDVVTDLPPGSTVLARAGDGTPQVIRFASRAWGVQFHPETGTEIFAGWAAEARERDPSDDRAERALTAIRGHEAALRTTWRPMAKAFAALAG